MRMMQKLKYISVILGAVAFVACSDDERSPYLNGKDKTPITVTTNLSTGGTVTRAVDATFESGDVLNAYIKHVTVKDASVNPLEYDKDVTGHGTENEYVDGIAPRLVGFEVSNTSSDHSSADNYTDHTRYATLRVTDSQGLYWDDFSNSKYDDTYLRTEGHALMVYYGYGYNGGTPSTSLTETSGVIGWTVATNQKEAADFKKSDLIYAGSQAPVAYKHSNSSAMGADHGVLTIPYTHAMSKVSIVVDLSEGFKDTDNNFEKTVVTLKDVNTSCTVTGPTKALSGYGTPTNVIMQPLTGSTVKKEFTALIAPTLMKNGQLLATITDVHGNNYEVYLTDDGLTTPVGNSKPWRTKLQQHDASSVYPVESGTELTAYTKENGGLTIPGVHYKLNVSIRKQSIAVKATIQPWDEVEATGTGEIKFENDITDKTGEIADALKVDGFDLYKKTNADGATYDADSEKEGVNPSSKVTWDAEWNNNEGMWSYSPATYWQNKDDVSYFRALAPADATIVKNGVDLLWGTTAAHSGTDVKGEDYSYAEGAAIAPRTGKVPLQFYHAMSKITVNLLDVNYEGSSAEKLDLDNAVIQFENLATSGSIDLHSGVVTAGPITPKTFSSNYYAASDQKHGCTEVTKLSDPHIIKDYIITPQTITDDATIIITLNNGTVYKAQLNKCKVTKSDSSHHVIEENVTQWFSRTSYTYEIRLSKEAIEFRALVEDWKDVKASGNATLEWD